MLFWLICSLQDKWRIVCLIPLRHLIFKVMSCGWQKRQMYLSQFHLWGICSAVDLSKKKKKSLSRWQQKWVFTEIKQESSSFCKDFLPKVSYIKVAQVCSFTSVHAVQVSLCFWVILLHTSPWVQQWTELFILRLRYWAAEMKEREEKYSQKTDEGIQRNKEKRRVWVQRSNTSAMWNESWWKLVLLTL